MKNVKYLCFAIFLVVSNLCFISCSDEMEIELETELDPRIQNFFGVWDVTQVTTVLENEMIISETAFKFNYTFNPDTTIRQHLVFDPLFVSQFFTWRVNLEKNSITIAMLDNGSGRETNFRDYKIITNSPSRIVYDRRGDAYGPNNTVTTTAFKMDKKR